ncbi:MAG TPA: hypothetical protein GYA08_21865 [Chloroflexi bacterium]|nr:hypothetical protein [Chloroflexota bacterium]
MLTQQAMQHLMQGEPATLMVGARTPSTVTNDPRQAGCGFFVGYFFYFGFFGYRQTPARAGAARKPG